MVDSFTIFDNVSVPWERVFMCGEYKFAGELALQFATYHRHSYTGCKPAITDVLLGAAALAAEYNGIEKAQHVRDKLTDMVAVGELFMQLGWPQLYGEKKRLQVPRSQPPSEQIHPPETGYFS